MKNIRKELSIFSIAPLLRQVVFLPLMAFLCTFAFAGGMELSGGSTLFKKPHARGPFIELLVEHSGGRRAGYDKKSGKVVVELPESCYVEQMIGANPGSKNLMVASPLDGNYVLYVYANDSGVYRVEADMMINEMYVTKSISGLVRKGDTQEIEITYSDSGDTPLSAKKIVDMDLLKKELEIALIKGNLDRNTGKEASKELSQAERAIANRAFKDAASRIRDFIKRIQLRRDELSIKNQKDIKAWFADFFIENPNDLWEISLKKELFFQNIGNIRESKKDDWLEAQSAMILIEDARTMIKNIPH